MDRGLGGKGGSRWRHRPLDGEFVIDHYVGLRLTSRDAFDPVHEPPAVGSWWMDGRRGIRYMVLSIEEDKGSVLCRSDIGFKGSWYLYRFTDGSLTPCDPPSIPESSRWREFGGDGRVCWVVARGVVGSDDMPSVIFQSYADNHVEVLSQSDFLKSWVIDTRVVGDDSIAGEPLVDSVWASASKGYRVRVLHTGYIENTPDRCVFCAMVATGVWHMYPLGTFLTEFKAC